MIKDIEIAYYVLGYINSSQDGTDLFTFNSNDKLIIRSMIANGSNSIFIICLNSLLDYDTAAVHKIVKIFIEKNSPVKTGLSKSSQINIGKQNGFR